MLDVIDTNALLDWLLERHPDRTASVSRLLETDGPFLVPDVVIAEVMFALQKFYRLTRREIVTALSGITRHPSFLCDRLLINRTLTTYLKHPSLSFVDCYLIHTTTATNRQLWTFDKKLVNQSAGRAKLIPRVAT